MKQYFTRISLGEGLGYLKSDVFSDDHDFAYSLLYSLKIDKEISDFTDDDKIVEKLSRPDFEKYDFQDNNEDLLFNLGKDNGTDIIPRYQNTWEQYDNPKNLIIDEYGYFITNGGVGFQYSEEGGIEPYFEDDQCTMRYSDFKVAIDDIPEITDLVMYKIILNEIFSDDYTHTTWRPIEYDRKWLVGYYYTDGNDRLKAFFKYPMGGE